MRSRRDELEPLAEGDEQTAARAPLAARSPDVAGVLGMQQAVGNQAVAARLAQQPGARLARRNRIVDDRSDPTNEAAPGQGRGLLVEKAGTPQQRPIDTASFGPLHNGCATSAEILLLPDIDDMAGTEPQEGTWPEWWKAPEKPRKHNYWVRGHLLNHNIGGPGEPRNLTPITKKCNKDHESLVERLCKQAARANSVVEYKVEAIYDATGPSFSDDRDKDPDRSIWPLITTGFQCEWQFAGGDNEAAGPVMEGGSTFIENKH